LITDHDLAPNIVGIGAATVLPKSDEEKWYGFGYLLCFSTVVLGALRLAENKLGSDKLEFVFDRQDDLRHRAGLMFDEIRRLMPPELMRRVKDPRFEESHEIMPLQAADLLAYETYKEMKNRREKPPRPVSKALGRLVEGRLHAAHYFDKTAYAQMRAEHEPNAVITLPTIYSSAAAIRAEDAS